jgi:hypothetical protein
MVYWIKVEYKITKDELQIYQYYVDQRIIYQQNFVNDRYYQPSGLKIQNTLQKALPFHGPVKTRLPYCSHPGIKTFRKHQRPGTFPAGNGDHIRVMHFQYLFKIIEIAIVKSTAFL